MLRIAICNLQTGIGTTRGYWQYLTTGWKYVWPHGSAPVEAAARFVRQAELDVVALCEVEGGSRRSRGVDQAALLAAATQLEACTFFPTLVVGERVKQGNAVCTRFPLRPVANHRLPGIGEPRFVSEAAIRVGTADVHLFVTHLSLERKVRMPQIHHLADVVRRAPGPTVLAGDFNVSEEAELNLLVEADLQMARSAPTFPSWKPKKRLDYLFFSSHFEVVDSFAFHDFRFSDHLPFVAVIRLAGAP